MSGCTKQYQDQTESLHQAAGSSKIGHVEFRNQSRHPSHQSWDSGMLLRPMGPVQITAPQRPMQVSHRPGQTK